MDIENARANQGQLSLFPIIPDGQGAKPVKLWLQDHTVRAKTRLIVH